MRLKEVRKKAKISQKELGVRIGIDEVQLVRENESVQEREGAHRISVHLKKNGWRAKVCFKLLFVRMKVQLN